MKLSEAWLREWVNPSIDTNKLVEQLTMAGLEVDAVEDVAGQFSSVVVGEILECEQHPNADKLRVCRVKGDGDTVKQVVCGAPNARAGIKVPFATVGAVLQLADGKKLKIKKAKLRDVESHGMLCAQTELAAGDDDDGLWELPDDAPVGQDLREYLNLEDKLIEVDLTPNRSDCLSVRGIAREVGVLTKTQVQAPDFSPVDAQHKVARNIKLQAPAACPRYIGRVIQNINPGATSPQWLQEKLRRGGVRSIDPVVDVTNFILLELGQPMHAFDLDKLRGDITVRLAQPKEKLTLLNDETVELNGDTLVIADAEGAVAMAGIMGGKDSCVTSATNNIFLESAFFAPLAIAGRARAYGLHTDSSHRFERGVDFELCGLAIERATALLLDIVGGSAGPLCLGESEKELPPRPHVRLQRSAIESDLGFAIPDSEVKDILSRLGMEVVDEDDRGWHFSVPSYRFDIAIQADLLEELARIYGYNNLPTTEMHIPAHLPRQREDRLNERAIKSLLRARDYQEVITYSFVDEKMQQRLDSSHKGVNLINPISEDMGVMRTSLFPGLLKTLQHNLNRQHDRVRIFETGLSFVQSDEGLIQQSRLAALICGPIEGQNWTAEKRDADFYDLKGDVESLLGLGAKSLSFEAGQAASLHPGQTAVVKVDDERVGVLGALHPKIAADLGITKKVFLFDLNLDKVMQARVPEYRSLSSFPKIQRDLAFIVDKSLPVARLLQEISASAGDYLKDLKVFDVYSGEGIDLSKKSIAINLTFQHPSRTLNDEEVNSPIAAIVARVEEIFDAKLR